VPMAAIQPSLQLHNIVAGIVSPLILQADALDRAQEVTGGGEVILVMPEGLDEGITEDEDVILLDKLPAVVETENELWLLEFVTEAELVLLFELLEELEPDPDPPPTPAHAVGNGSSQVVKQANPATKYDAMDGAIAATSAAVSSLSQSADTTNVAVLAAEDTVLVVAKVDTVHPDTVEVSVLQI
jgi:hypothetical protein